MFHWPALCHVAITSSKEIGKYLAIPCSIEEAGKADSDGRVEMVLG